MVSISTATCLVLALVPILVQVHAANDGLCPGGRSMGDVWEVTPGTCDGTITCGFGGSVTYKGCALKSFEGVNPMLCYMVPSVYPNCCGPFFKCRGDEDFDESKVSPIPEFLVPVYNAFVAQGRNDFSIEEMFAAFNDGSTAK